MRVRVLDLFPAPFGLLADVELRPSLVARLLGARSQTIYAHRDRLGCWRSDKDDSPLPVEAQAVLRAEASRVFG